MDHQSAEIPNRTTQLLENSLSAQHQVAQDPNRLSTFAQEEFVLLILGLATNIGIHLIKVTLYQSYDARLFAWVFRIQLELFDGSPGGTTQDVSFRYGQRNRTVCLQGPQEMESDRSFKKDYAQRAHAYL